jgi:hypothetical protein
MLNDVPDRSAPEICRTNTLSSHVSVMPSDELASCRREIAALNAQLAERNNGWSALYKTAILFAPRMYSGDIRAQVVHAERLRAALAVPLMGWAASRSRPGGGALRTMTC